MTQRLPLELSSTALYDALAPDYEAHFSAPHRKAYDELAWSAASRLLPSQPGLVIDVGCGVGRWAERLVALGHSVIGIEPAPAMAAESRRRSRRLGPDRFFVVESTAEASALDAGRADVVYAMGSLQYASDPELVLRRAHRWLKPGGGLAVMVDSLVGLVTELSRGGDEEQALLRARTRRGRWLPSDEHAAHLAADLHLFDRVDLASAAGRAGFVELRTRGLLVSASLHGRERLVELLERDFDTQLEIEAAYASEEALADLGKQLLLTGRASKGEGPRGRA